MVGRDGEGGHDHGPKIVLHAIPHLDKKSSLVPLGVAIFVIYLEHPSSCIVTHFRVYLFS